MVSVVADVQCLIGMFGHLVCVVSAAESLALNTRQLFWVSTLMYFLRRYQIKNEERKMRSILKAHTAGPFCLYISLCVNI